MESNGEIVVSVASMKDMSQQNNNNDNPSTNENNININKVPQDRRDSDGSDCSAGRLMVSHLYDDDVQSRKSSISFDKIKQISLTYSLQSEDEGPPDNAATGDESNRIAGESISSSLILGDDHPESSGSGGGCWSPPAVASPPYPRKVSVIHVKPVTGLTNNNSSTNSTSVDNQKQHPRRLSKNDEDENVTPTMTNIRTKPVSGSYQATFEPNHSNMHNSNNIRYPESNPFAYNDVAIDREYGGDGYYEDDDDDDYIPMHRQSKRAVGNQQRSAALRSSDSGIANSGVSENNRPEHFYKPPAYRYIPMNCGDIGPAASQRSTVGNQHQNSHVLRTISGSANTEFSQGRTSQPLRARDGLLDYSYSAQSSVDQIDHALYSYGSRASEQVRRHKERLLDLDPCGQVEGIAASPVGFMRPKRVDFPNAMGRDISRSGPRDSTAYQQYFPGKREDVGGVTRGPLPNLPPAAAMVAPEASLAPTDVRFLDRSNGGNTISLHLYNKTDANIFINDEMCESYSEDSSYDLVHNDDSASGSHHEGKRVDYHDDDDKLIVVNDHDLGPQQPDQQENRDENVMTANTIVGGNVSGGSGLVGAARNRQIARESNNVQNQQRNRPRVGRNHPIEVKLEQHRQHTKSRQLLQDHDDSKAAKRGSEFDTNRQYDLSARHMGNRVCGSRESMSGDIESGFEGVVNGGGNSMGTALHQVNDYGGQVHQAPAPGGGPGGSTASNDIDAYWSYVRPSASVQRGRYIKNEQFSQDKESGGPIDGLWLPSDSGYSLSRSDHESRGYRYYTPVMVNSPDIEATTRLVRRKYTLNDDKYFNEDLAADTFFKESLTPYQRSTGFDRVNNQSYSKMDYYSAGSEVLNGPRNVDVSSVYATPVRRARSCVSDCWEDNDGRINIIISSPHRQPKARQIQGLITPNGQIPSRCKYSLPRFMRSSQSRRQAYPNKAALGSDPVTSYVDRQRSSPSLIGSLANDSSNQGHIRERSQPKQPASIRKDQCQLDGMGSHERARGLTASMTEAESSCDENIGPKVAMNKPTQKTLSPTNWVKPNKASTTDPTDGKAIKERSKAKPITQADITQTQRPTAPIITR